MRTSKKRSQIYVFLNPGDSMEQYRLMLLERNIKQKVEWQLIIVSRTHASHSFGVQAGVPLNYFEIIDAPEGYMRFTSINRGLD